MIFNEIHLQNDDKKREYENSGFEEIENPTDPRGPRVNGSTNHIHHFESIFTIQIPGEKEKNITPKLIPSRQRERVFETEKKKKKTKEKEN